MDLQNASDLSEYLPNKCNKCSMLFDLNFFRPKVLPCCSQTFCLTCLKEIHLENSLKCPNCSITILVDQPMSLANNIHLEQVISLAQQLENADIQRKSLMKWSMHWCFGCESVAKPDCQENQHFVLDMSHEAKRLHEKMKQSKVNIIATMEKRRQLKNYLEIALVLLNRFWAEKVQELNVENSEELGRLQRLLERKPNFGDRQKIEMYLEEMKNALETSSALTDEWQARLVKHYYFLTNDSSSDYYELPGRHQTCAQLSFRPDVREDYNSSSGIPTNDASDWVRWNYAGFSGPFFAMNCLFVRIGYSKFIPLVGCVLFSSAGIMLETSKKSIVDCEEQPPNNEFSDLKTLTIPVEQLLQMEVSFNRKFPVIFIYVKPATSNSVCQQLGLSRSEINWNSFGEEESHKRLTLIPYSLDGVERNALRQTFIPQNLFREIDIVEAERLLFLSASPDNHASASSETRVSATKRISNGSRYPSGVKNTKRRR